MYPVFAVLLLALAGCTVWVVRRRGSAISEEALGFAVIGAAGHAPLHALVDAWRGRLLPVVLAEPDSAATITWPSRDVVATRVFLDHGLVPLAAELAEPGRTMIAELAHAAVDRAA